MSHHVIEGLNAVLVREMQKTLDLGYTDEQIVEHFHAEVGVQKAKLLEQLKHLAPAEGSKGAELRKPKPVAPPAPPAK